MSIALRQNSARCDEHFIYNGSDSLQDRRFLREPSCVGGGRFRARSGLPSHAMTNIEMLSQLLDVPFRLELSPQLQP